MQIWSVDLGSVADPGFPRGWGPNLHTILPNFPKNCMKLKAFGPGGGARPSCPLRSANGDQRERALGKCLNFLSFSCTL